MNTEKPKTKNRKVKITLIVLLVILIIRLALPYAVLHYANKSLAKMKGYHGKIDDINLALIRGAYKINKIYINKKDSVTGNETPFFDARTIDLSVEWRALLEGRVVGELEFQSPTLSFTKDKTEPGQVKNDTNDFKKVLDDLMPLKVNRFEINNGVLKYVDNNSSPPVDIYMSAIHLTAENLTNVKSRTVLPSTVTMSADLYEGTLDFEMQLDALADQPTFDMNAELKNTNLVLMNNFFKAYAKFDVNRGIFGLYTEGAAKDGKFVGYVKPVIKDLDVVGPEDQDQNVLSKFWEAAVGFTGVIFRNQRHDQVATKVPLEGTFSKTRVNILFAVLDILRNAFIQALQPSIDEDINIKTVHKQSDIEIVNQAEKKKDEKKDGNNEEKKEKKKGLFKKLFNKVDKEEKKDESEEKK
jgi:hypothetical protein